MSSDFKSNSVIDYDIEEPDSEYSYADKSSTKRDRSVFRMINSLIKQGNYSAIKVATNVARRAITNR